MLRFINGSKRLSKAVRDGSKDPLTGTVTLSFNETISKAFVVLRGGDLKFTDDSDHHLHEAKARVSINDENIDGKEVTVHVTLGLRDKHAYDDPFEGTVYFTVVGEVKGRVTEMTIKYE